jgi:MFS family permease
VFGEHSVPALQMAVLLVLAVALLLAYGWHATQVPFPLLRLGVFDVRTFRISVLGGFVTRLGIGGLPFLLPLLYQLGLGLPAWESGLLMMPAAAGAMFMKVMSTPLLRRFGYRQVLVVNTVLIAFCIAVYSLIGPGASIWAILALGLTLGLFNSLQFSSLNTMAYADIEGADASMASTIASTLQQMSLSFGLAAASLVTGFFLSGLPQSDHMAVTRALHHGYLMMAGVTLVSSLAFWGLRKNDGESVSKGAQAGSEGEPRESQLS